MKKVKLTLLFLISLVFAGENAFAERIPQSKALQIASTFMKQNSKLKQQHMAMLKTSEEMPSIATKANEEEPRFYIIGDKDNGGFVIVSADDRFSPILGYSLEGSFDSENIPENVENWLLYLRNEMDWAEENDITDDEATSAWKGEMTIGNPVKELSTAQWGQNAPYYNQCPTQSSARCLTGCVATAVAEVMRYHKYPKTGIGTISSRTQSNGVVVSERVLSDHTYDWDNMPLTTSEYTTDAQKTAVSTLMADVGAALSLTYSSSGTSGWQNSPALIDNFGYDPNVIFDSRDDYLYDVWIAKLKNEIDNNRPIIYDGMDIHGYGGHCFVIDGYDDQDYFHVNWGWNGTSNGYFLISALNPQIYVFTSRQGALLGFKPAEGSAKSDNWINIQKPGISLAENKPVQKNVAFTVRDVYFENTSVKDFTGNIAFMVVDKRGNKIETIAKFSASLEAGKGYYNTGWSSASIKVTSDIKPGYRIRFFYQPTGESVWYPMWREGIDTTALKQEVLIAEDVDLLEYRCGLKMNSGIVTFSFPEGATAALYNGTQEVTDGVTKTSTTLVVDSKKLTRGTDYKFHVEKDIESKDFTFKLNKLEN